MFFDKTSNKSVTVSQFLAAKDSVSGQEGLDSFLPGSLEEANQISSFRSLVDGIKLSNKEDRVIWKSNSDSFTSAAVYQKITDDVLVPGNWMLIWKLKVPPRVKLFLWQGEHNKLPTYDILKQRSMIDDSICRWCKQSEESQTHLFFNCSFANLAWTILKQWFGINSLDGDFKSFIDCFVSSPSGSICLASMFWSVWLAQNDMVFRGVKDEDKSIESSIKFRAFTWARAANLISTPVQKYWALDPAHSLAVQAKKDFKDWLKS